MKQILLLLSIFMLLPCFSVHGRENIVFYQVGERDPALWNGLKKYFVNKGYGISIYEGTNTLEKQIQNANKINKEKAALLLAVELIPSEKEDIFVAISNAKKGRGAILEIDEVPATHGTDSEDLATFIAAPFTKKVKRLPLFVFLGTDLPQVFLRINCLADQPGAAFDKLNNGIQNYLKRGATNEKDGKGERFDTKTQN
jgi:hypothetical protein